MSEYSDILADIRNRRAKRIKTAEFMASIVPISEQKNYLAWPMLLDVPDWCFWALPRREQLMLVVGALRAAPAMRLWIENSRIEAAKNVLGAEIFEFAIGYKSKENQLINFPTDTELREFMLSLGSETLLASVPHAFIQVALRPFFPKPTSELPAKNSKRLIEDAEVFITNTQQQGDEV